MTRKYLFITLSLLFLTVNTFAIGSAVKQAGAAKADVATVTKGNHVMAYYFHGNFRCVNCYNMEKWTKEMVEADFRNELASEKLVFRVVNTDTAENEHFMADYKLYTKSVVLALIKDGKEVRYDNLTKVWDYLRNEATFKQYVKGEIEKYLKEL